MYDHDFDGRARDEGPGNFYPQVWMCPVTEHYERRNVVTVEWRNGIAYCTADGCTNNSKGGA